MATIGKLNYQITTSADLKGMVATRAELRDAKKLFNETRTDAEKFGDKLSKIDSLAAKGAIDIDTHTRAVAKLNDQFGKTRGLDAQVLGTGNLLAGQVPGVSSFTGALSTIGPIGAAAVAGLGAMKFTVDTLVGSLKLLAEVTLEGMQAIDDTTDAAAKLGITGDSLEGLRIAAQRAGVDANTFDSALSKLNKNLGEAAAEGGAAAEKFTDLGLDVNKLANQKPDQTFKDIAAALGAITDPYERARVAQDLFGKSGQELIPVFLEGADAIAQAQKDAETFGLTVGEKARNEVAAANDALEDLGTIAKGAGMQIAVGLAPHVRDVADAMADIVERAGGVETVIAAMGQGVANLGEMAAAAFPHLNGLRIAAEGLGLLEGSSGDDPLSRSRELDKQIAAQQEKNKAFLDPLSFADDGSGIIGGGVKGAAEGMETGKKGAADAERAREKLKENLGRQEKQRMSEEEKAFANEVREGQRMIDEAERNKKRLADKVGGFADRGKSGEQRLRDKLASELLELNEAEKAGVIDRAENDRISNQLRDQFDKDLAKEKGGGGAGGTPRVASDNRAMARGSAEAFSTINRAAQAGLGGGPARNPNAKVEQNTNNQVQEQKETNRRLKELADKLPMPPMTVRSA